MQEEWGRRLRRLGTGVTTSGAGSPSPGEDEELSRSPTKRDAQGVLLTPFVLKRTYTRDCQSRHGKRRKWGLYGCSAPEPDAVEKREPRQLRGPLHTARLTVASLPPHSSGLKPLPMRSAPPP